MSASYPDKNRNNNNSGTSITRYDHCEPYISYVSHMVHETVFGNPLFMTVTTNIKNVFVHGTTPGTSLSHDF